MKTMIESASFLFHFRVQALHRYNVVFVVVTNLIGYSPAQKGDQSIIMMMRLKAVV